jgi:hypothetical protein
MKFNHHILIGLDINNTDVVRNVDMNIQSEVTIHLYWRDRICMCLCVCECVCVKRNQSNDL